MLSEAFDLTGIAPSLPVLPAVFVILLVFIVVACEMNK